MDVYADSLKLHEQHKGKLAVASKVPLVTRHDLSLAYTPGVAEPCRQIAKDKSLAYRYTPKGNMVAVVSDGSAVLGLGNIGAHAAIPVMEGKAILFKEFAGIDAFPICLDTQDTDEIVRIVKAIAPVFGAINLEDIAAPRCFEVEARLQNLGIPVMHDDQHGTAVVVLAGLQNAVHVVHKKVKDMHIVINGTGAAGTAIARMFLSYGIDGSQLILCDSKGIIVEGRSDLAENPVKMELAHLTNRKKKHGSIADAIKGADMFLGLSVKGILSKDMVRSMAKDPIIFAMANPEPEILPQDAHDAGAAVVATGRSDFPNQINNALGFPGIFRGALDARATCITLSMKLAAAETLRSLVPLPRADYVLPEITDRSVVPTMAKAVADAWKKEQRST